MRHRKRRKNWRRSAEQQVGGVVGGPVAAAVELAPGDDVGVVALGELRIGRKSKAKLARPMGTVVGSVGWSACLFS